MPLVALRDYFRNSVGAGINAASYSVKRLVDNVVVTSGSTAADADPATALDGMLVADETTIGYPGPIKYEVTDPVTAAVRVHTSKSVGIVGAWRSVDVTRGWRSLGTGVMPGVLNELAVTTNGTNMNISVAAGSLVVAIADHGMLYSWPAARSLTATAAHATLGRIDTVILRFYQPGVEQEGRVDLVLLAGTPNASPSAPALTQDATMWEVALANIQVDAAVTSLATDKVTDRRTYCFLYPGSIAAGDTFYVDANGKLTRLAKGTSGQYLRQGATIPAWDTITADDIDGAVSQTEFGFLSSVTSDIQTQLNAKQASDAELTALAGLVSAADKLPYFTGSGTASLADLTTYGRSVIAVANEAALKALVNLETGVDVQAWSANLDEYAAVNPTAAGLALLDDAAASDQRTTLGLGTIATQNANGVTITGGSVTGITDLAVADGGTGAGDAAGARTNLGLVIGTNVQAWDADLDTWAGKTPPSGVVVGTSDTQTLTNKTLTSPTISDPTVSGTAALANLTTSGNATFGDGNADLTTIYGRLKTKGGVPSIAAGAAAGTSPTISIAGNDHAGRITLSPGTSLPASGTVATITFAQAKPDADYVVVLLPREADALQDITKIRANPSTGSAWVISADATIDSNQHIWQYLVVEYEQV